MMKTKKQNELLSRRFIRSAASVAAAAAALACPGLDAQASQMPDAAGIEIGMSVGGGLKADAVLAPEGRLGDLSVSGRAEAGELEAGFTKTGGLAVAGDLSLSSSAEGTVRDVARTAVSLEGEGFVSVSRTAGSGLAPDRYAVSIKADGQVAEDDAGLVTGGAVWGAMQALRDAAGGRTSLEAADETIRVDERGDDGAGRRYSVSVNPDLKLSSLAVGSAGGPQVRVSGAGLSLGGGRITGLSDGRVLAGSTDAVNGGQLYEAQRRLGQGIADLHQEVAKAGAGAAALAALHPQAWDEAHKLSIAAGLGHYKSREALAIGAFLRPAENWLLSVGCAVSASDSQMLSLGVSYRFGGESLKRLSGSELSSRLALQSSEIRDLKAQLAALSTRDEALRARLEQ